jgi:hypothetical protein
MGVNRADRGLAPHIELEIAESLGYMGARRCGEHGVCGVRAFLFTGALIVGIGPFMHQGRYCYATLAEAIAALERWSGEGDPPGAWIKFKSSREERLGPGCTDGDAEPARRAA